MQTRFPLQAERRENNSVGNCVRRYLALFPQKAEALQALVDQLATDTADSIDNRKTLPGHRTASGLVLHKGKLLMVRHPYLHKWLQPGGHIESGETPAEAAMREVYEETGLKTQLHPWHEDNPMPFDINIHTIPANPKKQEPEHMHYDFRYLLLLTAETETAASNNLAPSELVWQWQDIAAIQEANLQNALCKLGIIA